MSRAKSFKDVDNDTLRIIDYTEATKQVYIHIAQGEEQLCLLFDSETALEIKDFLESILYKF